MKIVFQDALEEELRKRIAVRKGLQGVISEAIQEAIEHWLRFPQPTVDADGLRKEHPGKYLGLVNGEVVWSATNCIN